jgi:hypothetical protein
MDEVKEKPRLLFREELELKDNDIIPQLGMQEEALMQDADILIVGGSRGGGKSWILLLDPLYDIYNPHFTAIFFRKETGELTKGGGLYDKASKIYQYLGSKATALKHTFPSGAILTFDHIQNEQEREVEKRFKGLEVPAIYIDEIDQFSIGTFMKLMQSNRNSVGIRNRIIGTCNPNPKSWLRTFLDWYINEDGYIDSHKDRKTRYFYIYGTNVTDIIWGSTREEVYEKAHHYIDKSWNERFAESGLTKLDSIKSFCFIKGDLSENKILLRSQPTYYANVSQGGVEAIARNLEGNWNVSAEGDEMITRDQMEYLFNEERASERTGVKYASIDVALLGVDNFVIIIWDGLHIEDVIVKQHITSGEAYSITADILAENGVREDRLVYDYTGNGQALNDFKRAYPVKPQSPAVGAENNYDSVKSQILYNFGRMMQEGKLSCSSNVAKKMFEYGKGTKKERMSFKEIMHNERRALTIAESTGRTKMSSKKDMKKVLGGQSPDFLEAVAYRVVFELDKKKRSGFKGLEFL